MRVMVINGANVDLLGLGPAEIYGTVSYQEIKEQMEKFGRERGLEVVTFQSNSEGEVVNELHRALHQELAGVLINPGDFFMSQPIKGAVMALSQRVPVIEVHPTSLHSLGGHTVLSPVVRGVIAGFGVKSYLLALEAIQALAKR